MEKKIIQFCKKFNNIFVGFTILLIWATISINGMDWISSISPSVNNLFWVVLIAPVWEEAAFRYAPITIAMLFNKKLVLPVVIISSAIFGWGHGHGAYSVMLQGVGGLIYAWIYIRNGYSYWSSVTAHSMWNVFCFLFY